MDVEGLAHGLACAVWVVLISGSAGILLDADHIPYVLGWLPGKHARFLHWPAFWASVVFLGYYCTRALGLLD